MVKLDRQQQKIKRTLNEATREDRQAWAVGKWKRKGIKVLSIHYAHM